MLLPSPWSRLNCGANAHEEDLRWPAQTIEHFRLNNPATFIDYRQELGIFGMLSHRKDNRFVGHGRNRKAGRTRGKAYIKY